MNYKRILSPILFLVVSVVFSSCDPLLTSGYGYYYDYKTGVFTSLVGANDEEYRQMDMDYECLKRGNIYKFEQGHGSCQPIRYFIDGHKVTYLIFEGAMKKSHLVRYSIPHIPSSDSDNRFLWLSEYHY